VMIIGSMMPKISGCIMVMFCFWPFDAGWAGEGYRWMAK